MPFFKHNFQKPSLIFFLFLIAHLQSFAQYNETIRTARPGKSVGPFTTGKSVFQIQSGFNIQNQENSSSDISGDVITQFNSLRFGVSERVEIRSAFSYRDQVTQSGDSEFSANGINFWNVGLRVNLANNAGTNKPSIGIQGDVGLTTVSSDYEPKYLSPRLLFILGTKLYKSIQLMTNLGTQWSGATGKQSAIYTLNLGFPITKKLRGFIENYGSYQESDFITRYDTGLGYLANNNLAFDISVGYGENNSLTEYFIDFGISYRFKVKK